MSSPQPKLIDCPFTIFIDTAESDPFWFKGIRADANQKNATFVTKCRRVNLGRFPHSLGDYSLEGAFGFCAIERKSMEDAWGTLLGWPTGYEQDRGLPGRRIRFEVELENLSKIDCSLVVVEASFGRCLTEIPQWGVKPAETNRKIFFRTVLSYQQRFPRVQWMFCDTRRLAEITAFRWLYRYWLKNMKGNEDGLGNQGCEIDSEEQLAQHLGGEWNWV